MLTSLMNTFLNGKSVRMRLDIGVIPNVIKTLEEHHPVVDGANDIVVSSDGKPPLDSVRAIVFAEQKPGSCAYTTSFVSSAEKEIKLKPVDFRKLLAHLVKLGISEAMVLIVNGQNGYRATLVY